MNAFEPRFRTLIDIFRHAVRAHAERPLFAVKRFGHFREITYSEFGRKVDQLRSSLKDLGVSPGDRVAIVADNCPEWAVAAYATYGLRAAFVPMYGEQNEDEWIFILGDCGAKVAIFADEKIAAHIGQRMNELPALEHRVVIDGVAHGALRTFDDLLADGHRKPVPIVEPEPSDIAGLIYTSGTTGEPKGVRLSHANIATNISAIHDVFPIDPTDRSLAFLPWAHVFGQTVELHGLISIGASMALSNGPDEIMDELREVKPTLLFAVPRVFNRIYDELHRRVAEEGGVKKNLFDAAIANVRERKRLAAKRKQRGFLDLKQRVFERLVFERVRERFGGNLKYAFSGGASLSKDVANFVDSLGILVYEGYGLTETSPIVCANFPGNRKIGSVGRPIPGVRVEIDRSATLDPKVGEVLVFGHGVMVGYHDRPEEEARAFIDRDGERGLRTGDLGYLDGDGYLHLAGRIKEKYKLENGKYVVPTPLEARIRLSPNIAQCMIYGDGRPHNVALVVPDWKALRPTLEEMGVAGDPTTLVLDRRIQNIIEESVARQSAGFKGYERVENVALVPHEFSTDNGLLTPTLKIRRDRVAARYADVLTQLYEGTPSALVTSAGHEPAPEVA